jgi:membrane-associated protein
LDILYDILNWVRQLHSDEGVRALIQWGGLTVLVAIVFAETGLLAGFFLPGDSLLVTAGVVCSGAFPGLPPLDIWLTNVLLVLAAVIGDQVGYTLGRNTGRAVYRWPDTRFFRKKYLYEAQALYATKGGSSIVIARFVPIMRTFVPFIAGVAHMPYRNFVFYNVAGGILWVTSLLWVGYLLGHSPLAKQIHHVILLVIIVSVLPLVWEVWKRTRRSGTRAARADAPPDVAPEPIADPLDGSR